MGGLDLLPALGRALDVVLCGSCYVLWCSVPVLLGLRRFCPPGTVRPPRSGVSPFPGPADGSRTGLGRPSRLGAATFRATVQWPGGGPRRPGGISLWSPRRTANGSRPRAPWAQQTTIPVPRRPVKAGSLTHAAGGRPSTAGADDTRGNDAAAASLPGRPALPRGAPGSGADVTRHRASWGVGHAAQGNVVPGL